jgi:hypothetical protein
MAAIDQVQPSLVLCFNHRGHGPLQRILFFSYKYVVNMPCYLLTKIYIRWILIPRTHRAPNQQIDRMSVCFGIRGLKIRG